MVLIFSIIIIISVIVGVGAQFVLGVKLVILIALYSCLLFLIFKILIAQSLGAWHHVVLATGRMLFASAAFVSALGVPVCLVYLFEMETVPTMALLVELSAQGRKMVLVKWNK